MSRTHSIRTVRLMAPSQDLSRPRQLPLFCCCCSLCSLAYAYAACSCVLHAGPVLVPSVSADAHEGAMLFAQQRAAETTETMTAHTHSRTVATRLGAHRTRDGGRRRSGGGGGKTRRRMGCSVRRLADSSRHLHARRGHCGEADAEEARTGRDAGQRVAHLWHVLPLLLLRSRCLLRCVTVREHGLGDSHGGCSCCCCCR